MDFLEWVALLTAILWFWSALFVAIASIFKRIMPRSGVSFPGWVEQSSGISVGIGLGLLLASFSSIIFMDAPRSVVPVPDIDESRYIAEIKHCTRVFLQDWTKVEDFEKYVEYNVVFSGSRGPEFQIFLEGRSPHLAIKGAGYREKLAFRALVFRDFNEPKMAFLYFFPYESRQTRWPDNEQSVDDSKFTPFMPDQLPRLERFTQAFSTFLSGCIGRAVGPGVTKIKLVH